jgi:hypothetical protein
VRIGCRTALFHFSAAGREIMLTAPCRISLVVTLALLAQQGPALAAQSDSGLVQCIGTKRVGDTVGIVQDRKTGVKEQSLVQARLGLVSKGRVVGTVYVDDEGQRYIELKPKSVRPLPPQQSFGGEARLHACRVDSK